MSDNGWMLGDHGFTSKVLPYRPSTRVPMIIAGPGIEAGVSDALALNVDILPTILDLVHIKNPPGIHGKSLKAILSKKRKDVRDWFVYEGLGTYGQSKPNLTVINKEYRYIETYEDEKLDKLIYRELYNQYNDPYEMKNLADNPSFHQHIQELEKFIDMHRKTIIGIQ